jgi:hypothetical protein
MNDELIKSLKESAVVNCKFLAQYLSRGAGSSVRTSRTGFPVLKRGLQYDAGEAPTTKFMGWRNSLQFVFKIWILHYDGGLISIWFYKENNKLRG